ncbi:MAG TPA: glycoside hydrolase family 3 N-terminal domain-containing protein [Candidatus Saccharimonadales bacterium]|nr:glycoside hydrolase family 3 N-terminal domain-containing protein [Candidatus Saccharimonadales bacterium]
MSGRKHRLKSRWLTVGLSLVMILVVLIATKQIVYDPSPNPAISMGTTPSTARPSLPLPAGFTLQDKIGQLLVVGVTSQASAETLEQQYQIGGFLLRPDSDLFSKTATEAIKQTGLISPLLVVDEEGGEVSRLPATDFSLDSAAYLGTQSDSQVEQVAHQMGQAMVAIGANVDFAPVADLDNGQNTAISALDRSFSSDPAVVAEKAQVFATGLRQAGVVPTFKHFPGLGNATGPTGGNTDSGPAYAPSLHTLEQHDLLPYHSLLAYNPLSAVMVGNQIVPGLTAGLPASMSPNAYRLLRGAYSFQGVVFTDELLQAQAIVDAESSPAAAVLAALKAGADMPLVNTDDPATVHEIITTVTAAVQNHSLSMARLNNALQHVLTLKAALK